MPLVSPRVSKTPAAGRASSRALQRSPSAHGYAPGRLEPHVGHDGKCRRQSDGRGVVRHGIGLGFVLGFGYWCTDFLVVQRAMAANSMPGARRTPLIAAVPKMLFPLLVILPGMIAISLTQQAGAHRICTASQARRHVDYDMAVPIDARSLSSGRSSWPGTYRPDGIFHVRNGRQCDGVQYCLDLRHLSELHPARSLGAMHYLEGRSLCHGFWDRGCRLPQPISPPGSTTSWIFCSSSLLL